jgi:HEAT repeat protein
MQSESVMALKEMRPPASLLLPALEPHLKSTNSIGHPQALFVLGTAGDGAEQVVPWLCAALKGPEGGERWLALQSLGWLGTNARSAVPALIGVLKEGEGTRRQPTPGAHAAAVALGAIGPAAAPALPLVRALFEQETNWNSRCTLATAVCSIDAGQADAFAFLTNSLALHEPASERWGVVRALGNLGPNAKAAVPLLLAALDGTNDMVFAQVPRALKEMGVPVDSFLPRMRRQLQSRNETTRVNAAARLLELDPADREAVALLMSEIQRRAIFRDFAIETLAYTAPRVPEVLPLLHDLAQHGSKQEREVARRALKRIEARTASVHAVPLRP